MALGAERPSLAGKALPQGPVLATAVESAAGSGDDRTGTGAAASDDRRRLARRHAVVFCAALGGFADLYCTQAIYPTLQSRFDFSVAGAGALVTTTTLVLAVFAPYAGVVSNWAGARRATLAGLFGLAVCAFLMALSEQASQLIALRVIQGLFIPVVLASMLATNQQHGNPSDVLALSSTYVSGTVIGGVLGRLLPAALIPSLGWRDAFVVFALVHVFLFAVVTHLYAAPPPARGSSSAAAGGSLRAVPKRRVLVLGLAGFSLLFGQAATFTYIAIRFASPPFEWTAFALGAIYLVFLPPLVLLQLSRGLIDRIGPVAALKRSTVALWCGLLLTLAGLPAVVMAGLVLFAIGVFLCQAILASLVSAAARQDGAPVAGIYLCCYYLGASAGALAPAFLWADFGWPGCVGLIAGVQIAVAIAVRRLRQHDAEEPGVH